MVKGYNDGTLSFRRSCAHGVCGSDAMRINGRNMLACKTLVRDVGENITVEPILGLKVVKDLIVDMEPFFDNYKKMLPYFINESPLPADGRNACNRPEDRARFDDTTKCILCAACTTSCPSFWASDDYLGPAALVTAHRFIFDSRDEAASERLQILSETYGVARCHTALQLHRGLPARDPDHEGDRRVEDGDDHGEVGLGVQGLRGRTLDLRPRYTPRSFCYTDSRRLPAADRSAKVCPGYNRYNHLHETLDNKNTPNCPR